MEWASTQIFSDFLPVDVDIISYRGILRCMEATQNTTNTNTITEEQIAALELIGGNRWTKGDHDRIYFNLADFEQAAGLRIVRKNARNIKLWELEDGEWFEIGSGRDTADYVYARNNAKVWVDVATGEIFTRVERERTHRLPKVVEACTTAITETLG